MSVIPALKRLTQKGLQVPGQCVLHNDPGGRGWVLRIVSSLCGTGQTEYPHAEEWDKTLILYSIQKNPK